MEQDGEMCLQHGLEAREWQKNGELNLQRGIGQAPECGMEMGTGLKTRSNEKLHEKLHEYINT